MEEGWEPRHDVPHVDAQRLKHLVRRFAGTRPFVVGDALPGGLANLNVRVSLDRPAEDVVLRVYLRDPSIAGKEAALLDLLGGTIPVARLLHRGTDDGHAGEMSLAYLVTSWVRGRPLTDLLQRGDERAQSTAGRQIGRALAILHARRYAHMGFLDATLRIAEPLGGLCDTFTDYVGTRVRGGPAGRHLGRSASARLLRFVEVNAQRLAPLEGRFALLHADCKPTNVCVTREGELAGLMDWEFAWAGPPLFDLGQMFRWPTPRAYDDALAEGYVEAGGLLPDDWRALARLLDLLNLVGFLDDESDRPVTVRDVKRLIEATLSEA